MIGYDLGMHRAGVLLDLFLLACHAGTQRRRVLMLGVLCYHRVGDRQRKRRRYCG